jgi:hypothetical protein
VTIIFNEDFTYTSGGISFQLNCYSQEATNVQTDWQQYVIREMQGSNDLTAFVDNWLGTDSNPTQIIHSSDPLLAALPSSNTIRAGYSLTIALKYDSAGNVAGATYSATDNNGKLIGDTTINILDQFLWANEGPGEPPTSIETSTQATTEYLAPIVAIALNIGGFGDRATAILTEGAGTIVYKSTNTLIPADEEPAFVVWDGANPNIPETGENSNIIFDKISDTADNLISQYFTVSY